MDIVKDALAQLASAIRERAYSPVWGTFAIVWLLGNVPMILIVFDSIPVASKLEMMRNDAYVDACDYYLRCCIVPTIAVLYRVLVYPLVNPWIYSNLYKSEVEIQNRVRFINNKSVVTDEDARLMRERIENLENELLNSRNSYESSIANMREENRSLRAQVLSLSHMQKKESEENAKTQERYMIDILSKLELNDGMSQKEFISSYSREEASYILYCIDELVRQNFVSRGTNHRSEPTLTNTAAGRSFMIRSKGGMPPST